ncbi:MAG: hypothetical protein AAGA18_08475 [Verrucomicrobiota bacterium]
MECKDVPALARFEAHVLEHSYCSITQSTFKRVSELIQPVLPPSKLMPNQSDTMLISGLRESCQAVESATRIIWACAACTDNITPRLWDEAPEFEKSITYFRTISDLDFMDLTKQYRLSWELKKDPNELLDE